jgi:uncharacterized protein
MKKMKTIKLVSIFFVVLAFSGLRAQSQMSASVMEETIALARQYLTGNGKPRNETKAMELYQQCAAEGSGKAMNAIGIMYKEGIGVAADSKAALEWLTKATKAGYTQSWYNLGMIYKEATGEGRNYKMAYDYFCKGVSAGDDQCVYAKGYMHYKGLGCKQDYALAASLFTSGAELGRSNSMYFLGLCYRNGYGVPMDTEKAKFWLVQAANKGYDMAIGELKSKEAENSNTTAKALAQQLRAANNPQAPTLNEYRKIEHNVPADAIEGTYTGHLIKYDWSGQHAIRSAALNINISYVNGKLTGMWIEDDSINVPFQAMLTRSAMVFQNTQFSLTDHYSPRFPVTYQFENAKLQWQQKGDKIYLSGNLQMFSQQRNEPQKPVYVALTKTAGAGTGTRIINLTNDDGSPLMPNSLAAYPNPFSNVITVDFELKEACEVQTQLMTLEGKIVYTNSAKKLEKGNYTLPLQPQDLPAGTYLLKLQYGKEFKTVKVVKL